MPYASIAASEALGPKALESRREKLDRFIVPDGVRALFATVDVQANRFEVLVMGHGFHGERWIMDRFAITETESGIPLQPPLYDEHWDVLASRVINATYRLPDGREMRVARVGVDSGGYQHRRKKADSTRRAYNWWRRVRADGLGHRVRLLKGEGGKHAQMLRESYPDSQHSKRKAGSRGDVPLLLLSTDAIKDALIVDLQREVEGPGFVHIPEWLSKKHRDEILSEHRTPKGWEPLGRRRNETWDLLVYDSALWLWSEGDKATTERCPAWMLDWDRNPEVITAEQRRTLKAGPAPTKRRASSWL
jgi:phage terminase large subunit GpA-like protein